MPSPVFEMLYGEDCGDIPIFTDGFVPGQGPVKQFESERPPAYWHGRLAVHLNHAQLIHANPNIRGWYEAGYYDEIRWKELTNGKVGTERCCVC